jgi:hypothetical protein
MVANFYLIQQFNLDGATVERIVKVMRVLTVLLSVYAIIEYLLKQNLLYGSAFQSASVGISQEWSVYRITTLIGHPLSNATFFGIASLLYFLIWISSGQRKDFLVFFVSAISLGLTAARGSILIYGFCLSIIILIFPGGAKRSGRFTRLFATLNISILGIFVLLRGIESLRFSSLEGSQSTTARILLIERAIKIIPSNVFGFGPGTAQEYFTLNSNTRLIVENSIFEILLGFGIIGGLIIGASVLRILIQFISQGSISAFPFIFLILSSTTYNFVEGNRNGYVLFSLLYLIRGYRPLPQSSGRFPQ